MKTGDEASVAKTINARSRRVYNCNDKLAKELYMFLLRSAYFLLTIKVPSPDFEISAKEYVFLALSLCFRTKLANLAIFFLLNGTPIQFLKK